MALKVVVDKIEDVAEAFRGEYEPKDGKFHLKVDGDIPEVIEARGKLKEFRDNNTTLKEKVGTLSAQLERVKDINPEEYEKATKRLADLEKAGVKGANDVEGAVQAALSKFVKDQFEPVKKALTEEKQERAKAQERLNKAKLREVVGGALAKAGARPDAIDFLLTKAETTFKVEDGEVVAQPDHYSPTKVSEPITIEEWVPGVIKENSFAFETSKGGGAKGSGDGQRSNGKTLVDPTPQELGRNADLIAKGELQVVHTR